MYGAFVTLSENELVLEQNQASIKKAFSIDEDVSSGRPIKAHETANAHDSLPDLAFAVL